MKPTGSAKVKRYSIALLSALCLVLGAAATSQAAGAPGRARPAGQAGPPDGMSWATYRLMAAQVPLDQAATKIQALAAKPGPAHRGFFATAVNDRGHALIVYWHGRVPAGMGHLIGTLRASVAIEIVKTRYSLARLHRDVLAAIHLSRQVVAGWPMTGGSGIHLSLGRADSRSVTAFAAAMRSRFGVPVVADSGFADHLEFCEYPGSASLLPGSRCDDVRAFWGGDAMQQFAFPGFDTWCSSAFGVHDSAGHLYLLTAAHCADNSRGYANGITFYNGQDPVNRETIGQITDVPGSDDAAIIPTATGDAYYDGPGLCCGDTYRTKIVAGQLATSRLDNLCESGAIGGVVCNFTVQITGMSLRDPNYPSQNWNNLDLATSGSGQFPMEGDSGGPWFSLDGSTHVWAKGITHGNATDQNTGINYAVFTPVTVASHDMGVTVNSG
jgi:hypothetical protein